MNYNKSKNSLKGFDILAMFEVRLHIQFLHAFSALQCIFEVLTLVWSLKCPVPFEWPLSPLILDTKDWVIKSSLVKYFLFFVFELFTFKYLVKVFVLAIVFSSIAKLCCVKCKILQQFLVWSSFLIIYWL